MVRYVEYGDFLSVKWNIVTVTNNLGQKWELKRIGISENEVRDFIKSNGKTEGIKTLISEGKLVPIYGGNLNL